MTLKRAPDAPSNPCLACRGGRQFAPGVSGQDPCAAWLVLRGRDKAEIYPTCGAGMDPHIERHLRGLYGLDPDVPHVALGFPRLPPLALARLGLPADDTRRFGSNVARAQLDAFVEAHRRRAAGLVEGKMVVPPGHPLYDRERSAASLRAENDMLRKENQDLKARLGGSDSRL